MKKATIVYTAVTVLFGIILCCFILLGEKQGPIPFPDPVQTVDDDTYMIDLNTATAEELMQIPGVGQSIAENIVRYREDNGPFQEYGELLNVKGIGKKKLTVIMKYVRIK